ncbi:MAG TPA: hypothetical protein VK806_03985 [Bacteroidia bacterium]|jgi:hypothetical protein|nr:hypothetical protein [Bacteroidia bacterium]
MRNKISYKGALLAIIMCILLLPLIQSRFKLIKVKPLFGLVQAESDTTFSWPAWFSSRFQYKREKYLNDSSGLREIYIRIHNQIDFTVFKKIDNTGIISGKDGTLFSIDYAKAYAGSDYIGIDAIVDKVKKLRHIQDILQTRNKTLIVLLAPGKASYEPELLPDFYRTGRINNYVVLTKIIKGYGLNCIDFNDYFRKQRNKAKYPLYTKYTAHWSRYGVCLAGDSIVKYIERIRNIDMVHPDMSVINVGEAEGGEVELENEMNLLFDLKHEKVGIPVIKDIKDSTKAMPKLFFIGDSYFWNLAVFFNFWNEFSNLTFCYYGSDIYRKGGEGVLHKSDINLKDEIDKADVIILESTELNYDRIGWWFSDEVGQLLITDGLSKYWTSPEYITLLRNTKENLKSQPQAFKDIVIKAKNRKISVDSMLTLDAIWCIEHQAN